MAEQKKDIAQTFKIYYGVKYGNTYPLHVRRITAYLLDDISPKLQALQDFVNGMFEDVAGQIKDLKDSDKDTLALLRKINTTLMNKEELNTYFNLLVSVVAGFLNYENGKIPPQIVEAFDAVNNGVWEGNETFEEFWKQQDLEELKSALTYFRSKAGIGKV